MYQVTSLTAIVLLMALSIAPPVYFWRLSRRDHLQPRLWLPRALAIATTALCPCILYLGTIAAIRVVHGLSGVPPWTSGLTTGATIAMASTSVYLLLEFLRHR